MECIDDRKKENRMATRTQQDECQAWKEIVSTMLQRINEVKNKQPEDFKSLAKCLFETARQISDLVSADGLVPMAECEIIDTLFFHKKKAVFPCLSLFQEEYKGRNGKDYKSENNDELFKINDNAKELFRELILCLANFLKMVTLEQKTNPDTALTLDCAICKSMSTVSLCTDIHKLASAFPKNCKQVGVNKNITQSKSITSGVSDTHDTDEAAQQSNMEKKSQTDDANTSPSEQAQNALISVDVSIVLRKADKPEERISDIIRDLLGYRLDSTYLNNEWPNLMAPVWKENNHLEIWKISFSLLEESDFNEHDCNLVLLPANVLFCRDDIDKILIAKGHDFSKYQNICIIPFGDDEGNSAYKNISELQERKQGNYDSLVRLEEPIFLSRTIRRNEVSIRTWLIKHKEKIPPELLAGETARQSFKYVFCQAGR